MKIEYIYNSSYHVITEHHQILFDYYRGPVNLVPEKPCIFVVTHAHGDHFSPVIFDMKRPGDILLLSWDTEMEPQSGQYVLEPHKHYHFGEIEATTCGSTDAGLSLLLKVDGHTLLHAGDLNLWIWPEDTAEECRIMQESFEKEVACLGKEAVEVAFFPVDGRLEDQAFAGAFYFMTKVNPKLFIPMHFREDFDTPMNFYQKAGNPVTRIWVPRKENDIFHWKDVE